MIKTTKMQTCQNQNYLGLNISKSGCRMTHLPVDGIYCLHYCDFDISTEKHHVKILHNPQVPLYLKPEMPGMRKNITNHCTKGVGKTIKSLLDNAADYESVPQIYSSITVIGYIDMFVYFRFQQNANAARIQKLVNKCAIERLLFESASNMSSPFISPTSSHESVAADDNVTVDVISDDTTISDGIFTNDTTISDGIFTNDTTLSDGIFTNDNTISDGIFTNDTTLSDDVPINKFGGEMIFDHYSFMHSQESFDSDPFKSKFQLHN